MYWIVDANTRRSVRKNRYGLNTVISALYELICNHPDTDFLITDQDGKPVPASRIRRVMGI